MKAGNGFRKCWWIVVALCLTGSLHAKVVVHHLFGDGMVLQRGEPVNVWGTADAGEQVTVTFTKKRYQTTADEEGRWMVTLPAREAGGPYELQVNGRIIKDILIGDVFLCSGQSNMEVQVSRVMDMFGPEIEGYENGNVRYVKLPYGVDFNQPHEDIAPAEWHPMTKPYIKDFAALAYFMAKLLYEKTGVPVGIVNSSWGGSTVEAWMSEESLRGFPFYLNQKAMYTDDALVQKIQEVERLRGEAWARVLHDADLGLHDTLPWYAKEYDDTSWETVDMFSGNWAMQAGRAASGAHWLRKTIDVPASWQGKEATLRLGCIVNADSVYVNGVFVGTTSYQYPPRIYHVPASLLTQGENQITIRLTAGGRPSFIKDKPYKLICGDEEIDLQGMWKHRIGADMPGPASSTAFNCLPVGIYNCMVYPLRHCTFKGVVWYQGESNIGEWNCYADLLTAMMNDWRALFGKDTLPFYIVELADFLAPEDRGRDAWAKFRSAQAAAAARD
ncbi:MAG: sialate O-acetylesterase, partial [Prevotellaceae bacterium]|nr:sialate O-acetylesterase [Prevotellaceae bacterium]